jgi:hypothetical protein
VKPSSAERGRLSLNGTGKPPGFMEFGLYVESGAPGILKVNDKQMRLPAIVLLFPVFSYIK